VARDVDLLVPGFRCAYADLLDGLQAAGHELRPFFTLRTPSEQAKLWRQSRSTAEIEAAAKRLRLAGAPRLAGVLIEVGPQFGRWATNALPGYSWHNWGEAADAFVVGPAGEAVWDADDAGYRAYAEAAEEVLLTSGASWGDPVHVQLRSDEVPDLMTAEQIERAMLVRFPEEMEDAMTDRP